VLDRDFPDPFVFHEGPGEFTAFSTNSTQNDEFGCVNRVPFSEGTSPGAWGPIDPSSAASDGFLWEEWDPPLCFNWAPVVHRFGSTYALYFTGRAAGYSPPRQCIGVATSTSVDGPYEPPLPEGNFPLVCNADLGGSIDPSVFVDSNGQAWLLWKTDGNAVGQLSNILAQRLRSDGLALEGPAFHLMTVTQAWESGGTVSTSIVEAPEMIKVGDYYYLFYSGNRYNTDDYAIGYAICGAPQSGISCTKPQDGPILATGPNGFGPGGQSLFEDGFGNLLLAYHAWRNDGSARTFRINYIDIVPGSAPKIYIT